MKLQLSRNTQPVFAPNWHPNFRNTELLPDLKVIRTSFFVNLVCVTVASAAMLFTVFREYTAFNIRADISRSELRVDASKEQNAKLLAMNREFSEANRKFVDATHFVASPVVASDLLVALSKSLPSKHGFYVHRLRERPANLARVDPRRVRQCQLPPYRLPRCVAQGSRAEAEISRCLAHQHAS